MSTASLAIGFSLVALLIGAVFALRRSDDGHADTPESDGIIDLPSFSELEPKGRDQIVRDAMLLATELSRVDDYIAPSEVDSIRDFIFSHVGASQVGEITEAMRNGMSQPATPAAVSEACARIRDGFQLSNRELVAHFLVHVAHADGMVCPEEQAFLQRVVTDIGVAKGNLDTMMSSYASWAEQQGR